jgi:hypothetical protein
MNRLCHSRTRVRDITLSPYTSFNSWKHSAGVFFFFFNLRRNFRLIALLDFHPNHESWRATQHGHTQTKLKGKPTYTDESSLVLFEKLQIRLPITRSPLLQVSTVECAQSRCFIAAPRTPRKSLKRQAQETGVSKSNARRATHVRY